MPFLEFSEDSPYGQGMLDRSFTISVLFRIILLILFLALVVGFGNELGRMFALPPDLFGNSSQVWRLITWPLAPSFGALLIGAFAFFTPAEELEGLLGSRTFGFWIVGVILGSGLLHLALFSGTSSPSLTGVTAPAFFVMTGYIYFYPRSTVKVFFVHLSLRSLATIMVLLWVFFILLNMSGPADLFLLVTTGGAATILSLIWFQGRYQRYDLLPGLTWLVSHLTGVHESGASAEKKSRTRATFGRTGGKGGVTRERTEPSPVQRADMLLEKISSKGLGSLTNEERAFLEDYSKRIQ